jgi:hypothetical protein
MPSAAIFPHAQPSVSGCGNKGLALADRHVLVLGRHRRGPVSPVELADTRRVILYFLALTAPIADSEHSSAQALQAGQILSELNASNEPQLVVGDFNANPTQFPFTCRFVLSSIGEDEA